jgi:hypothetical protein
LGKRQEKEIIIIFVIYYSYHSIIALNSQLLPWEHVNRKNYSHSFITKVLFILTILWRFSCKISNSEESVGSEIEACAEAAIQGDCEISL